MTGEITLKALLYYILKAKYLKRQKVGNRWKYWYKPASQRGAHEFTKKVFEKKTKLTDSTHKDSVEKILQNGGHVNLRILRDYPDLAKKYNQEYRLVAADKIRARVKGIKESAKVPSSTTDDKGREEKKMNWKNETLRMRTRPTEEFDRMIDSIKTEEEVLDFMKKVSEDSKIDLPATKEDKEKYGAIRGYASIHISKLQNKSNFYRSY